MSEQGLKGLIERWDRDSRMELLVKALEVAKVALRNGSTWEQRYNAHGVVVAALQEIEGSSCPMRPRFNATRAIMSGDRSAREDNEY